jgi:hypothetical protein
MGMRLMSELLDEGADVLVGNDTMVLILASCVYFLAGGIHKADESSRTLREVRFTWS